MRRLILVFVISDRKTSGACPPPWHPGPRTRYMYIPTYLPYAPCAKEYLIIFKKKKRKKTCEDLNSDEFLIIYITYILFEIMITAKFNHRLRIAQITTLIYIQKPVFSHENCVINGCCGSIQEFRDNLINELSHRLHSYQKF